MTRTPGTRATTRTMPSTGTPSTGATTLARVATAAAVLAGTAMLGTAAAYATVGSTAGPTTTVSTPTTRPAEEQLAPVRLHRVYRVPFAQLSAAAGGR